MNLIRSLLIRVFIFSAIWLIQPGTFAQHPEIGFRVVLSGAWMFGPYFTYWMDDHNALNASILAAYEGELVVPFALNAGYSAFFFSNKWRPEIGLQYSYLISPRRSKSYGDPNGISILSVVPGVQFRWDNTCQNVQTRLWLAHLFEERQPGKKFEIFPIGLDFSYGYKFP